MGAMSDLDVLMVERAGVFGVLLAEMRDAGDVFVNDVFDAAYDLADVFDALAPGTGAGKRWVELVDRHPARERGEA